MVEGGLLSKRKFDSIDDDIIGEGSHKVAKTDDVTPLSVCSEKE